MQFLTVLFFFFSYAHFTLSSSMFGDFILFTSLRSKVKCFYFYTNTFLFTFITLKHQKTGLAKKYLNNLHYKMESNRTFFNLAPKASCSVDFHLYPMAQILTEMCCIFIQNLDHWTLDDFRPNLTFLMNSEVTLILILKFL